MHEIESQNQSRIFAIGGGKGGVGKSVLAASLSMGLAMLHKEVTLVDADFGGANLHKILGMESVLKSSQHFLQKKVNDLSETAVPHPRFNNLKFIRSMNGYLGGANIPYAQKLKLIRHFHQLPSEYVVLDLGGGADYHVLDFFLAADEGVVVVTPDPLSILEAYHFIKQVFFRKLTHIFRGHQDVSEILLRYAHEEAQNRHANVHNMMTEIRLMHAAVADKIGILQQNFRPRLIINRLRKTRDENNCMAIKIAAKELLSITVDYWGAIRDDPAVYDSLFSNQPFISYNSKSRASRDLATIVITKMLRRSVMSASSPKMIKTQNGPLKERICTVHCEYWETCQFKQGGLPCDLLGF